MTVGIVSCRFSPARKNVSEDMLFRGLPLNRFDTNSKPVSPGFLSNHSEWGSIFRPSAATPRSFVAWVGRRPGNVCCIMFPNNYCALPLRKKEQKPAGAGFLSVVPHPRQRGKKGNDKKDSTIMLNAHGANITKSANVTNPTGGRMSRRVAPYANTTGCTFGVDSWRVCRVGANTAGCAFGMGSGRVCGTGYRSLYNPFHPGSEETQTTVRK